MSAINIVNKKICYSCSKKDNFYIIMNWLCEKGYDYGWLIVCYFHAVRKVNLATLLLLLLFCCCCCCCWLKSNKLIPLFRCVQYFRVQCFYLNFFCHKKWQSCWSLSHWQPRSGNGCLWQPSFGITTPRHSKCLWIATNISDIVIFFITLKVIKNRKRYVWQFS